MSNKFGTVDVGLWKHPDFKILDDDAKLLFLHLKTCDNMNMIGCFYQPIGYMTADLNWSPQKVKQTLSKLFKNDFIRVDEAIEMVFLPKHLNKHPLQNPNQGKGAERLFDEIPKRFIHIKSLAAVLLTQTTLSEPFRNRLTTLCNSVTTTPTITTTTTTTDGGDDSEQQETLFDDCADVVKEDVFDAEKAFEEFWQLYPRKEAKKKAGDSFRKACVSEVVFADIMAGLSAQIEHKWRDPKYIPIPTTWLNGARWEDEIQRPQGDQALDDFINDDEPGDDNDQG